VTGGAAPARDGWFYEPTVLAGDLRGARIEHEEVFGPVVTVQPFEDEAQAVGLANASPFGLGASVWTGDAARGRRVAARLEAGMVWVNDAAYSYAASQTPWGGTKQSGFGRTHGKHGLYEVSQVKYVDTDAGRLRDPWWYPYDDAAADGFRGALGMLYGDGLAARASAAWRHRRGLVALGRRSLKR
jgi:succinate-semialdehyde dehydrogenase/glutarate-semialdehyde dehydrogenase